MSVTNHQLLTTLVENSLLHLYFMVSGTRGFVSNDKRDAILAKFLKPKIKDPSYKGIKGEIKRLVLIQKRKGDFIEPRLIQLYEMASSYEKKMTDAQKLFDLLVILHEEHGVDSRLYNETEGPADDENTIFILPEHIEYGFGDGGEQLAPVSLLIKGGAFGDLETLVEQTGLFRCEVVQRNLEKKCAQFDLHPITFH